MVFMCCNRESTEQILELLKMVYADNLKTGSDSFDMRIKNKSILATFSRKFSNNMTIDKLQRNTEDSSVRMKILENYAL